MSDTKTISNNKETKPTVKVKTKGWSEERRKNHSRAMRRSYAKRKIENLNTTGSVVPAINITLDRQSKILPPQRVIQEIPRVGNYWVYDVKYRKVGWRRLIMPVPFRQMFPDKTVKGLQFKMFFANANASTLVQVLHFYTYSLRAEAVIPVYEVIYSPWVVEQKIRPEQLLQQERLEEYTEVTQVIAGYETMKVLAEYENEKMMHANYKHAYKSLDSNIDSAADERANDIIIKLKKGQKPPSEAMKLFAKISHWVGNNKLEVALILIMVLVLFFGFFTQILIPAWQAGAQQAGTQAAGTVGGTYPT